MCQRRITFAHKIFFCAMEHIPSFNSLIEKSIKDNWNRDALTDFKGKTLQFHDVARKIEKTHIIFENIGIQKGDKIALCGRNSANWAVLYLSTITYGAVVVPIQHEFKAEQIHNIVNHSEAKLLYVGDVVATQIDPEEMPNLQGVIYLPDFSIIKSRSESLNYAREHLNAMFGEKYPKYFRAEHVHYHVDEAEELALINYTSGTTGFSKGVMLPYRTLWSNIDYLMNHVGTHLPKNCNVLSILPMAHMFGLAFEFLFEFIAGNHIFFLTRLPSPTVIHEAFQAIHPAIIISVPLIVDKIVRKKIFPKIQTNRMRLLMNMPVVKKKINEKILELVKEEFGGNAYEIIVGGASLNPEIEQFLKSIHYPITVGYGTTETAPLITFSDWHDFVSGSCGRPVDHMEVKINSEDPTNIPGELLTRGLNVMQGYYKNQEATKAALDKDGWYHSGDLATMSEDGHVFIRGRIKNMLLGSNGQNIYPEEIENKLNSMAMVNESIILQKDDQLVGLVHPDMEEAKLMGFTDDDLINIMEENRQQLNKMLPPFCKISNIRLHGEEFQKTPKKSIKRYLYQDTL